MLSDAVWATWVQASAAFWWLWVGINVIECQRWIVLGRTGRCVWRRGMLSPASDGQLCIQLWPSFAMYTISFSIGQDFVPIDYKNKFAQDVDHLGIIDEEELSNFVRSLTIAISLYVHSTSIFCSIWPMHCGPTWETKLWDIRARSVRDHWHRDEEEEDYTVELGPSPGPADSEQGGSSLGMLCGIILLVALRPGDGYWARL
jgi:hypothetical protein